MRQRPKLVLHQDHGEVPIHNNTTENEIRPFAQGRRVWLFANNPLGARASANLFSLVGSARANGLDPYAYLNYVFEKLPTADTVEALEALLPGTSSFFRAPPSVARDTYSEIPHYRVSTDDLHRED